MRRYQIYHNKVQLRTKFMSEEVAYLDLKKAVIYVRGRKFSNINDFINNEWSDLSIRTEAKILYHLYKKDREQKELIVTKEIYEAMKL